MRGLSVLVVEAHDVAWGTSSRSTRLVHGGVRYLEQGELGLVYEALRERSRLYAAAPHLVRPARFLFPSWTGDRLAPWRLRIGLSLYDLLDAYRNAPHEFLGADAARVAEPLLRAEGLRGAVQYEDAITDDARLTLTVLQDARRHGARVWTYAPVAAIEPAPTGTIVVLQDGTRVAARAVVVAAGPWTDGRLLGHAGAGLVTMSRGIHLVLRHVDVPVAAPVVIQAPAQRRILFVVPWGTRTYVGTTDDRYEGDPGDSGVADGDEAALLSIVARLLPGAALRPDRIVSAWSGVRPLVRADGGATEELSRRHRVVHGGHGVVGVVGGKLTTYRAMAEEIVDAVVRRLGDRVAPCRTHAVPLVPGLPLTAAERRDPLLADLQARHGPTARRLAARVREVAALGERLVEDLPYRRVEVEHAIAYEGCRHVHDVLRRRLPLSLTDPCLGGRVAPWVARQLVEAWGGSGRDIDDELERYRELVHRETRRSPKA